MVELVGHTLLDSSISLNVDNIASLVGLQVGRKRNGTMVAEFTREHVAGTSANYIIVKINNKKLNLYPCHYFFCDVSLFSISNLFTIFLESVC